MEEVVDEMLAILSDRNRIMQKKEPESVNVKWNEYMDGCDIDLWEMYRDYIDGKREIAEINASFHGGFYEESDLICGRKS